MRTVRLNKKKGWVRLITFIVITAMVCQNVVWAGDYGESKLAKKTIFDGKMGHEKFQAETLDSFLTDLKTREEIFSDRIPKIPPEIAGFLKGFFEFKEFEGNLVVSGSNAVVNVRLDGKPARLFFSESGYWFEYLNLPEGLELIGFNQGVTTNVYKVRYKDRIYWAKFVDRDSQAQGIEKQVILPQEEVFKHLNKFNIKGIRRMLFSLKAEDGRKILIFEELPKGEKLTKLLGSLTRDKAIDIMLKVLYAVRDLHKENVHHWDLKPDHVWITEEGGVKIFDFDFAFMTDRGNEFKDRVLYRACTPSFESQERYLWRKGSYKGHEKDFPHTQEEIYSLGMLFLNLLANYEVAPIEQEQTPMQYANDCLSRLRDMPGISDELIDILRKALKDGRCEYKTVDEFITALKPNQAHLPIEREGEGEGFSNEGEVLTPEIPVSKIDLPFFEKLREQEKDLPPAEDLLKAVKKIMWFYKMYVEEDISGYCVQIRRGMRKPLLSVNKTIVIDIDILRVRVKFRFLLLFLLHLAGHEGGHIMIRSYPYAKMTEEIPVLFMDALRFSKMSVGAQEAVIGAFRSLKGLKDARYAEFLERIKDDPNCDLAQLIKTALGIDDRYIDLKIFENGKPQAGILGTDEIFGSFRYPKVKWSLVITQRRITGQEVYMAKRIVLFDEKGRPITDERLNGVMISYRSGVSYILWESAYLKPEHQKKGLDSELCEKIEEFALLNAFGDEYPKAGIELTADTSARNYWEEKGYTCDTDAGSTYKKSLDIVNAYNELAKRVVPLIIKEISPVMATLFLPERFQVYRTLSREKLLDFLEKDAQGTLAGEMLDNILKFPRFGPLLSMPNPEMTPYERRVLYIRLKQLHNIKGRRELNDALDSIYLRYKKFNEYLVRARAEIELDNFKDTLSHLYLLVDMEELNKGLAVRLDELRRKGRIKRVIWVSPKIADETEIRSKLREFWPDACAQDLIIASPKPANWNRYAEHIKGVLEREGVPLKKLILITPFENYTIYIKLQENQRGLEQSFSNAGNIILMLTKMEYDFLEKYLPREIRDKFINLEGRCIMQLDPLTEDLDVYINGFKSAREHIAESEEAGEKDLGDPLTQENPVDESV